MKKIVAILGTYRKDHVTDKITDIILKEAKEQGAEVTKVYLIDKNIKFCTNCRSCTQTKGLKRGLCIHNDDMNSILEQLDVADGIVLSSPVNFGNVTAVNKIFIERLITYGYWPWGSKFPRNRIKKLTKKAVLVTASGAPSFFTYFFMDTIRLLRDSAKLLGAKNIGTICMGMASMKENPELPKSIVKKAKKLSTKLLS